jgi:protein SCO1/2
MRTGLAAIIAGALAACASPAHGLAGTHGPAPGAEVGTALDQALPASVLDLPLTSSDGKVVVISDMMTLCQETCPMDTATVVQTVRDENAQGHAGQVVYLSITVDPGRDTPAQLHAYRELFAPAPTNWHLLTGQPSSVAALWKFFGVWQQKVPEGPGPAPRNWRDGAALTYDVSHSDEVFFLDRHGHERFVLEGPPTVARALVPRALRSFLNAQGRHNLTSPASTDWNESQARRVLAWLLP